MIQTVIVIMIFAIALFFVLRRIVRTLKGKAKGCSNGCEDCQCRYGDKCEKKKFI